MKKYEEKIRSHFQFMDFAPILFTSALNNERVHTLLNKIGFVYANLTRRVNTSVLNDVLMDAVLMNQPPVFNGNRLSLSYATQSDVMPPSFVLFVNSEKHMHFSYLRYLENRIRDTFEFEGAPIKFVLRKKED
jgi:GTP-binding protein